MARKTTKPRPFCFVLMPFEASFNDIYKFGIKEACQDAGAFCQRVDEQIFTESMLDQIYSQISKADLVVADMTGRNPNVFYEVGYAHALGKRVVLLTHNADDIPFDLRHYPHIVYGGSISDLRAELTRKAKALLAIEDESDPGTAVPAQILVNGQDVLAGPLKFPEEVHSGRFNVLICNTTSRVIDGDDIRFAIVAPERDRVWLDTHSSHYGVSLPDGRRIGRLNDIDRLYPSEHCQLTFQAMLEKVQRDVIALRVYTKLGANDFPIEIYKGEASAPP